jgi:PAS domain S-box-containing protein
MHQKTVEYTGATIDEHRKWKTTDTIHPADRARVVQAVEHSLRTGEDCDIEYRSKRFDGVYRWFNSRGHPQRKDNGDIVRWCFLLVDVDDRKQSEEELRQNQAYIAEGQRLSQTGTFYWNTQTNERRFSDELYRLMEIEPGTVITDELLVSRVHPDDHHLHQQKVEAGQQNRGDLDYEIRLRGPSGKVRWVHTIGRSYLGENGSLDYIGAVRDITERHNSEEVLGKLRSELTHIARVTSLGALTASIAHEVNQPLAGILTNASTGLRMLSSDPPNVSGALETARRTIRDANRASDVITRLRAMFTKKEMVSENVQLNEAAQEVIALSLTELQRNRLVVLTEFADHLPVIQGDRVQLQQVILNLLLNASDAMRSVTDRPRELLIRTTVDLENGVRMTVRDSGVGIDLDNSAKLFEPFYTTKNSGMGIGLSVSRGIIERHGGRLWAEPNEKYGASFSFSIPNPMEGAVR